MSDTKLSLSKKSRLRASQGGLVITRHPGKSIQIGDDVFITFLSNDSEHGARIRVQAPRDMRIKRLDQID